MTPDLWRGDTKTSVDGNISHWREGSKDRGFRENIIVWDYESAVAEELAPLNNKIVAETGLTALIGTKGGTLNYTVGIPEELEQTAVLKVQVRKRRK